ncbi:MAG: flagellar assembly peptidoglycan hydrolase FlgJ [Betaproteobacteria bacterium]|nr:flagellar assembly peptidoglycan hydrolase FlgJ [Betaproteobacteria bacterium]
MEKAINQISQQAGFDGRALDALRRGAADNPDRALKAAATQFEALFMNMILKSMRDALPKDELTASQAGDTYTAMLDQKLAENMAARGTGLADLMVKQLSRQVKAAGAVGGAGGGAVANPTSVTPTTTLASKAAKPLSRAIPAPQPSTLERVSKLPTTKPPTTQLPPMVVRGPGEAGLAGKVKASSASASQAAIENKRAFVTQMEAYANAAEKDTGIPARFMVGQAALESGWGRRELKHADGSPSFNLFGIKATGNWKGPTVSVTTTEFVDGVARRVVEKFRAYASYAESFSDYARLLTDNPRYSSALESARQGVSHFADALQRAGYATDPSYAAKVTRVIHEALNVVRRA